MFGHNMYISNFNFAINFKIGSFIEQDSVFDIYLYFFVVFELLVTGMSLPFATPFIFHFHLYVDNSISHFVFRTHSIFDDRIYLYITIALSVGNSDNFMIFSNR